MTAMPPATDQYIALVSALTYTTGRVESDQW